MTLPSPPVSSSSPTAPSAKPSSLSPPRKAEHPARSSAETLLFDAIARPMERASFDAARRSGAWLGLALFGALRHRRSIGIANIQRAFPELSPILANRVARRSLQNFGMTFCEFLHQRTASPEEIRRASYIEGLEHIEQALGRGRGCILLTAHIGNWELMGARAAQEFPLWVVARPTSNPRIEKRIRGSRAAQNVQVLSKHDSAREVVSTLRKNVALGILPDQHGGPNAPLMPLFGHSTRVVDSPFRLAQLARAPIVPAYGVRRAPWLRDGRIIARVGPGFDVGQGVKGGAGDARREAQVLLATQRGLRELEEIVRLFPDQWLWIHKRWRQEDQALTSPEGIA